MSIGGRLIEIKACISFHMSVIWSPTCNPFITLQRGNDIMVILYINSTVIYIHVVGISTDALALQESLGFYHSNIHFIHFHYFLYITIIILISSPATIIILISSPAYGPSIAITLRY